MQVAYFAAGCFWSVQASFDALSRDIKTTVGYMGGTTEHPTYEQVCSHTTGHAETVKVEFEPTKVTYRELLDAFWRLHDPTQFNRQGPDVGDQYRSAIFYTTPAQKKEASASRETLATAGDLDAPIATAIELASRFWPAEEYHQKHDQETGRAGRSTS